MTADEETGEAEQARGGTGAGGTGAGGSGAGDAEAERARRLAAWTAARRKLSDGPVDGTLAGRLARLAEEGAEVYDLDGSPDIYGDGIVARLEERTAAVLGHEAAAFFPTGTMAQQVALRCWAGRTGNPVVALHPVAHPERHERGALGRLSGLGTVHPTTEARPPTAEEVRELEEPFGTLMLELPLRDAGFVLPTWDELVAVAEAARERDAVVHFDGARLWECTTHFGRTLPEIAALADSVYVSFYKSLGGLSGAALAGPADFVAEARAWRHRYGGQVFQQWPAALSALVGLERELPRLPRYTAHATMVAAALREGLAEAGTPWFRIHPAEPHTHQFQVWLPYGADGLTEAGVRQAEEDGTVLFRVWDAPGAPGPPGTAVTEVTVGAPGLRWGPQDVRDALYGFLARVPERGAAGGV
ncbi:threonine aldolase family protein [Streptomyces radiopugnans]|uniref:L-threonine aldolase n=1 Tax=Streptomyces radiopugnans TaxID=403935 RepID=A0A1H9CYV4_9ACTN|nr:beta-eliminating lyase-related protein [Streptomyces radiopugnans]SEQ06416.1 L-threonine aldolase [Streptomyces radiopugnans]